MGKGDNVGVDYIYWDEDDFGYLTIHSNWLMNDEDDLEKLDYENEN
jgi:hypothetical protein